MHSKSLHHIRCQFEVESRQSTQNKRVHKRVHKRVAGLVLIADLIGPLIQRQS